MSSPILPNEIEHLKCCLCGREFSFLDHLTKGGLEKANKQYGDLAATAIHSICPDCLEAHRPKIKKISGNRVIIKPYDPLKGSFYLFISLSFLSIIALSYSLVANSFNLRNLPFNFYISIHIIIALLSFLSKPLRSTVKGLFKPPWSGLIASIIMVLSITFFVPSFRHIFYSYLPTRDWKVVITLLFIVTLCLETQLIQLGLLRLFSRYRSFFLNQLSYLVGIIILLGFISPFYFGVIKMNPYSDEGTIRSETVDKVYEERFPTEKVAPREAARRYFVEGKKYAAKGNRTGFIKSIQLYERALELMPNFSSAYAEMAYSYASIAKILEEARVDKRGVEENLKKAEKAIEQAKRINPQNPTVFAVDLFVQYVTAKYYLSHKKEYGLTHDIVHEKESKIKWAKGDGLKRLRRLAERVGFTDKVYLTEAILTEDRIKKGSSLLTIIERLDSDNAEVHNLLGIVYYLVNDKDSAKKMFERAKRLSPNFGKPYLNLALVYPKKEVPRLYRKASAKDEDLRSLADYYANLFRNMKRLRWFYVGLVMVWFLGGSVLVQKYLPKNSQGNIDFEAFEKKFSEIQKDINKATSKFNLSLFLIFIGTYVTFETWVHFIKPINGLSHMFPVRYPFF